VEFSPDGRYVATASYDRTVKVWEPLNGVAPLTLEHAAPVRTVEFSPDGRYLVTACWDFTVWVWDVATGKLAAPPLRQTGNPLHAAFDPEGRRIVTADMRGVICLYDLSRNNWLPPPTHAVLSGSGSRFAILRSNEVQVCDAATQAALASPIVLSNPLKQVRFTRDGRRLLTVTTSAGNAGAGQGEARLWDAQTGQALCNPFTCSRSIKSFSLDQTGQRALALNGSTVEVWDTSAGKVLAELPHATNVAEAIFSPTGKEIATASGSRAQLWASDSGHLLYQWPHDGTVSHVEISPQGNRLVTTCSDNTLNEHEAQVWDTITGRKVGLPLRHRDGVLYAAFSPDGRRVVTASEDRIAQVWETETGQRLGPRLVHRDEVFFAAFSPDGRWVVTSCRDNTVRVWDASTGVPITPRLPHPDLPLQARFVPNSRYLVTSRPGSAQTWWWELAEDRRPVEDLMRLTRLLAGNQSDQTGSALPLTKSALRELWEQLRRQYPADFTSSSADIALWRQLEAAASEKAGQWFAALFHLDRLIESNPTDASLRERQARAQSKLAAQ
jgi:WD40 repeat protein